MRVLKNKFRALAQRGLFHILTANAVNKIIGFLSNILVVRLLTTTEYGIFSVANNVYSIAMIFIGFGSLEGILQYGC